MEEMCTGWLDAYAVSPDDRRWDVPSWARWFTLGPLGSIEESQVNSPPDRSATLQGPVSDALELR